jgi:hypothetical protein
MDLVLEAETSAEEAIKETSQFELTIGLGTANRRPDRENADQEVVVRGEFLRALLSSVGTATATGLRLTGARVLGTLDLAGMRFDFPLFLLQCTCDNLELTDTRAVTLNLQGSEVLRLCADRMGVERGVLLGRKRGAPEDETFVARKGVSLPDASIGGDLNCDDAQFEAPGKKSSALLLDGARIEGRIFLRRAQSRGRIHLYGTRVEGSILASQGTYEGRGWAALTFDGARVGGSVDLDDSECFGSVGARYATIEGQLTLMGLRCYSAPKSPDDATHLEALDRAAIKLDQSTIGGINATNLRAASVIARGAELGGVDFTNAMIDKSVQLEGARVDGDLTFEGTLLANQKPSTVLIGAAEPNDSPDDQDEEPPAALGAQGLTIEGGLVWQPAEVPARAVDLRRAQVGFLSEGWRRWPVDTDLSGLTYQALGVPNDESERSEWLSGWKDGLAASGQGRFVPQPYQHLGSVLRGMGYEAEATDVAIAAQRQRRKSANVGKPAQAVSWLLDKTISYGYHPLRLLWGALAVVVIGTIIFGQITMDAKPALGASPTTTTPGPPLHGLGYSLDAFLPIIDLHQEDGWSPHETGWKTYLWLHIALGWLVTTLAVVAVTAVVRRE